MFSYFLLAQSPSGASTWPYLQLRQQSWQSSLSFRFIMFSYRVNVLVRSAALKRGLASQASQSFNIPVIDFAKFRSATSPQEKRNTAGEIVSAFKQSGFIYLSNHGIDACEY